MKKLIITITVIAMFMSMLAACADSTGKKAEVTSQQSTTAAASKQPEQTTAPQEPVTLQMGIWGSDAHAQMYKDLAAKYKEKNPNVSLEVQIIPWADYQQKLSIMKAGNQAPDICWLAERMLPQFLETNQLLDISEIQSDTEYDFSDIIPSTLELAKKDGKYYGIAFSTPPVIIAYNKTLFKEKNLKTPMELYKEGNWNYDEMLKAAIAITDKSKGVYGIKLNTDNWKGWADMTMTFTWGFGGEILGDDKTKFTMNIPAAEQAVQLYMDMIFKYECNPKPGDPVVFESGKIGMTWFPLTKVKSLADVKDFEWDVAPFPEGPAKGPLFNGYAAYVMFSNGEKEYHNKARFDMFKYLTSKEGMTVTSNFFIPSRKSIYSNQTFLNSYSAATAENVLACLDQVAKGRTLPSHMNWQKIDSEVQVYFDMMYTQSITVKEALKQIDEKVAPMLKQ